VDGNSEDNSFELFYFIFYSKHIQREKGKGNSCELNILNFSYEDFLVSFCLSKKFPKLKITLKTAA
jgi:hypothetical protein